MCSRKISDCLSPGGVWCKMTDQRCLVAPSCPSGTQQEQRPKPAELERSGREGDRRETGGRQEGDRRETTGKSLIGGNRADGWSEGRTAGEARRDQKGEWSGALDDTGPDGKRAVRFSGARRFTRRRRTVRATPTPRLFCEKQEGLRSADCRQTVGI